MLTLFTTAKPFSDPHIAVIQDNAFASWTRLDPRPKMILFGDEPGTGEAARKHGMIHIPQIERSPFGAPLVADLFDKASAIGHNSVLCYVNADIMLMQGFCSALSYILSAQQGLFLAIGYRWNVDITEPWDFSGDWRLRLAERVEAAGEKNPPTGIDYFVYRPQMYAGRIDRRVALARGWWDWYLVALALQQGAPVIDLSAWVMAVHQNHPWVKSQGQEVRREHPEMQTNEQIIGHDNMAHLEHVTHRLRKDGTIGRVR